MAQDFGSDPLQAHFVCVCFVPSSRFCVAMSVSLAISSSTCSASSRGVAAGFWFGDVGDGSGSDLASGPFGGMYSGLGCDGTKLDRGPCSGVCTANAVDTSFFKFTTKICFANSLVVRERETSAAHAHEVVLTRKKKKLTSIIIVILLTLPTWELTWVWVIWETLANFGNPLENMEAPRENA